jgi:hypothetical protein
MGTSAPTGILVEPPNLDFGVVPVNCNSTMRTVTVYNTGNSAVTINQVYLDPTTTTEFQLMPVATPVTLQAGGSLPISVTYHPINVGRDSGVLFIQTSAVPQPFAVALAGDGEVNATVTETFQQLPAPEADVLFVVDNSGSMSWAQASLGSNIGSFVQYAQMTNANYHIGATTTDVELPGSMNSRNPNGGERGALVGSPLFITPMTPNGVTAIQNNVNVGTSGSGLERGLEAMYLALSDPMINTTNMGFLRPEAALAVIVVSDDDDTRQDCRGINNNCPNGVNPGGPNEIPGPGARPVDFYVNFLRSLKPDRSMVSFSAVVEINEGDCVGSNDNAEAAGWRYQQVAMQTGGIIESICATDWGMTLSNIGLNTFGLHATFGLSSTPVASTIAVSVNGSSVPQTSAGGQTNWNYDPGSNSIVFVGSAVPPNGATITVTYSVACIP